MVKHVIVALISLLIIQMSSSTTLPSEGNLPSADSLPLLSLRIKPNQTTVSTCAFRVVITTGCSSVKYTRDQISLSFGDAYGNQVYVPRIDDPNSGTFERCSTDTFDINGPCTYDVCYVYLYRRGNDGWDVGSVTISNRNIKTATFHYENWLPSNTWFGFNCCNGASDCHSVKPRNLSK